MQKLTLLRGLFVQTALFRSFGAKSILLLGSTLILNGCLSITTTQPSRPAPTAVVTKTETVYVTENGRRVQRVVRVDSTGRRYYDEGGRTVYVSHYEY